MENNSKENNRMSNVIDTTKNKEINITFVEERQAPDIQYLSKYSFESYCCTVMEDELIKAGIVLNQSKIKELIPAYYKIGKKYWSIIDKDKRFII